MKYNSAIKKKVNSVICDNINESGRYYYVKRNVTGMPGWLGWWSGPLRLKSYSHGLWVWAFCQAVC